MKCTVDEFSKAIPYSKTTIYRYLAEGHLQGVKVGGAWLIDVETAFPEGNPKDGRSRFIQDLIGHIARQRELARRQQNDRS